VTGYRNLQSIRESLKSVMIRRTKHEVLRQLPGRTDKNFFVPMTREQFAIHDEYREVVAKLVYKWKRFKFLSDADQKRLMMFLDMMRMVSDNTYLVDKKTIHGPKIEELEIILRELVIESGEKVVVFTQWLRMAELVEEILKRNGIGYTHLHGGVPSKKRRDLIETFREDPKCDVFLSADAGGIGLNLQSGSVVINVDIPWNPAVLEQRIGRVHRMGQKKPVQVINFVTTGSIEERILDLLKFKKSVFSGALDKGGLDTVMVGESKLNTLMRTVETMTQNLPEQDRAAEQQKLREDKLAEEEVPKKGMKAGRSEAAAPGNGHGGARDSLNDLFQSGARFLSSLGELIAKPGEPVEKRLQTMIGKDAVTDAAYLKVPLSETERIRTIFAALGELLSHAAQVVSTKP
jgi:superfamily II DNA/RNA helicase